MPSLAVSSGSWKTIGDEARWRRPRSDGPGPTRTLGSPTSSPRWQERTGGEWGGRLVAVLDPARRIDPDVADPVDRRRALRPPGRDRRRGDAEPRAVVRRARSHGFRLGPEGLGLPDRARVDRRPRPRRSRSGAPGLTRRRRRVERDP